MWLVVLNYSFECDWLIELSDNNLASELLKNRSFFRPITIEEIEIFMINLDIAAFQNFKLSLFLPHVCQDFASESIETEKRRVWTASQKSHKCMIKWKLFKDGAYFCVCAHILRILYRDTLVLNCASLPRTIFASLAHAHGRVQDKT